jgi:flagellar motor switch protein FliN
MALLSTIDQSPRPGPAEIMRILRISVPVIVKLAERNIPTADVMKLSVGSILEFHKSADAPLELMINNKTVGVGLAVKVGENFGIRLSQVGDVRQIIRSMGQ